MKPCLKGVPKAKAEKYPMGALCSPIPGQDPSTGGTGRTQRPPDTTSTACAELSQQCSKAQWKDPVPARR